MRIHNIRQTVRDIKSVPEGFHVEVWSEPMGDGAVTVWTSECLSQNSWTINHSAGERRLDRVMHEISANSEREMSITEQIRRAVESVWGDWGLLDTVLSKDRRWDGASIRIYDYVLDLHEWEGSEAEDWEADENGYVPSGYVYADVVEWDGFVWKEYDGACVGYGEDTTLRQWIQGVFPDIL